jgi:chromosome partitioning protein
VRVVAVVGGKGGVGKTTTAVSLAALLSERGPVLLVDADPQASASWWCGPGGDALRPGPGGRPPPPRPAEAGGGVRGGGGGHAPRPALRSPGGGAEVGGLRGAAQPAGPLGPGGPGGDGAGAVRPLGVAHRVLLTRVDPRSLGEALEAQTALLEAGVPAFHAFVRAYKAHERAALEGKPITRWRGPNAREAEADYRRVAEELLRELSLPAEGREG